jgi:DNA-binding PadR family transcriptional regulator
MERDLVLLGVLRQGAMHGYRIAEIVENELGGAVDLKRSTTYYLLERLARDGHLKRHRVPAGKRPTRYVYELTKQGNDRFFELLRLNLEAPSEVRFGGDAGLAFLDELDPDEARRLLSHRLAVLKDALEAESKGHAAKDDTGLLSDHQAFFLSEEIVWVEHVIDRLRSKPRAEISQRREDTWSKPA